MVRRLALAAPLALILTGSAGAGNPWNLHCASIPSEQPVPAPLVRAEKTFTPWGGSVPQGLRAGPVYLLAGSRRTAISRDGDTTDASGEYLHRAIVAVAPSYRGPVVITGRRLKAGARTRIGFSTNGAIACSVAKQVVTCDTHRSPLLRFANRLTIPGGAGWRIVRTEIRIGRTGCFRLIATGPGLHATIPLAVPGPDWGTPGW